MRKLLWLPLLFGLIFPLYATQVVQVTPPNPTASDVVALLVSVCGGIQVTRIGNEFRLDVSGGCVAVPQPPATVTLGLLPPGIYTYAVYQTNQVIAGGSFIVAPSVPALSQWMLLAVAVLLSVVGYFSISR